MGTAMAYDDKDLKLLHELQRDSRQSQRALGDLVDLAPNTVNDRIAKLLREKAIRRMGAVLNPAVVGLTTTAFVFGSFNRPLKESTELLEKLITENRRLDGAQIVEVHTLFGSHDVLLKVRAEDNEALEKLLSLIKECCDIRTNTQHVGSSLMENDGIQVFPNIPPATALTPPEDTA